ncbi:ABC transporter permease [Microvirga alba]|uniref:ABC transporter permease n=1 Tax=Microvirga alba TaxID=2791025 RepID=A0A931BUR5_9HYPH|nr:ABC transporter permease [Microvirga alba]MBF9235500.1 ABC transporter permease [Microvirga alba]
MVASKSSTANRADAVTASQAESKKASTSLLVWTLRLGFLVALLAVWHYAVQWGYVPEFYISTPTKTALFLWKYIAGGEIFVDASYTIYETLMGFSIGSVAGIVSGLLLARFTTADRVLSPFLSGFNALPRVALAPLFILWFGIGTESKIVLAFSLVFFITLVNTNAGARATDSDIMMMARAMGATSRQTYLKVVLPYAIPSIFAGLRLAAVYALLGAVVGEMLAAQHGWGRQITYYSQTFEVAGVFGLLVVLATFSIGLNYLMVLAEQRLLRWKQ